MDDSNWLGSRELAKKLGYSNISTISKIARNGQVRIKKSAKNKTHHLYYVPDFIKAIQKLNYKKTNESILYTEFRKFDKWKKVKLPAVIIADAHCPFVDFEFLDNVLRLKDRLKIDKLILAGDTLDCSSHSKFFDMFKIDWDVEKDVAREFLEKCAKEFDNITLLTANHELRFMKMLNINAGNIIANTGDGRKLDIWETVFDPISDKHKSKFDVSIYPYCDVGKSWMVVHPKNARKQPLSLGRELHGIYGKSIIVTHAHMTAWTPAPCAKHTLIDCGVFADPKSFAYKNINITSHYQWSESCVILMHEDHGWVYRKGDPLWDMIM